MPGLNAVQRRQVAVLLVRLSRCAGGCLGEVEDALAAFPGFGETAQLPPKLKDRHDRDLSISRKLGRLIAGLDRAAVAAGSPRFLVDLGDVPAADDWAEADRLVDQVADLLEGDAGPRPEAATTSERAAL